jgi:FkbM family methyltransferase
MEVGSDAPIWAEVLRHFRSRPAVERIPVENETLNFRIAYWNPITEHFLVSGYLFETSQLRALRSLVPPGAVIVDVGANIGQHTVYFAKIMKARSVIAIEPNPDFVGVLKENVALNGLTNVDFSHLGTAVGERPGRCRVVVAGNPQDTIIAHDPEGELPVAPLDSLIADAVDLVKIDVDEQEIAVLNGMTGILSNRRPVLAVEVVHRNLPEFLALMARFDYRVHHLFSNPQYHDIAAVPAERPR